MITCPFCGEKDFDLPGLKMHIQRWCEVYWKVGNEPLGGTVTNASDRANEAEEKP